METCPQCGASLGAGYRFCSSCGAPAGGCPSCGEPVVPGDRFCHSCGHALTGKAPPPAEKMPPSAVGAHLTRLGDTETTELATAEAPDIAGRLGCQPLLDRAAALTFATPVATVPR